MRLIHLAWSISTSDQHESVRTSHLHVVRGALCLYFISIPLPLPALPCHRMSPVSSRLPVCCSLIRSRVLFLPSYTATHSAFMGPKRKRSAAAAVELAVEHISPVSAIANVPPIVKPRLVDEHATSRTVDNPSINGHVLNGANASRASPESPTNPAIAPDIDSDISLSDAPDDVEPSGKKKRAKGKTRARHAGKSKESEKDGDLNFVKAAGPAKAAPMATKTNGVGAVDDPEAESNEEAGEQEIAEALTRPPPVNSDYLPLPWKGRLGFVSCLLLMRLVALLTTFRLVSIHIFGHLILPSFPLAHAVLPLSSTTVILSRIQRSQSMQQRTDPTRTNRQIYGVVKSGWSS